MDLNDNTIEAMAREAITHFWRVRAAQASKQKQSGKQDQGFRGAVTGGAQMNGFISAFERLATMAGISPQHVYTKSRFLELPGYFRPTKEWDLLIVQGGTLLAAMEAKSQAGSFGNNFNNRTEEAMGSALDLWTAFREKAFKRTIRPWLGYMFLLEDCPQSQRPIKNIREPHFKVFPEFRNASYAKRYEVFCKKLVLERHYDAAALLLSKRNEGITGQYEEPCEDIGFRQFVASFLAHLQGHKQ